MDKIQRLAEIVRQELQRQEDVYLKDECDIEKLARAVEACTTDFANEVGPGFDETIPKGCRLLLFDASLEGETIQRRRKAAAEIVRSHDIPNPITVIFRPQSTCWEPPLDPLAKAVVGGRTSLEQHLERKGKLQVATMRDELLLRLWDALFLTACEHWSEPDRLDKGKEHWVTNTTLKDTQEFAWYFWRGQEIGRQETTPFCCIDLPTQPLAHRESRHLDIPSNTHYVIKTISSLFSMESASQP